MNVKTRSLAALITLGVSLFHADVQGGVRVPVSQELTPHAGAAATTTRLQATLPASSASEQNHRALARAQRNERRTGQSATPAPAASYTTPAKPTR